MKSVSYGVPVRIGSVAKLVAGTSVALAAVSTTACSRPAEAVGTPPHSDVVPATLVTVQLDVSGTGTGDITYSTAAGLTRTAKATVLRGWRYSYDTDAAAPITLRVAQSLGNTSNCAVHVDGQLHASSDGPAADCSSTGA